MQRMEADDTPAEEWLQQLNAVCNRLSTQYLSLLRTASSVTALGDDSRHDPRCEYTITIIMLFCVLNAQELP